MNACPDCGARPGFWHGDYCDVARCLMTGHQRLSCEIDHDHGSDTWTGEWPGDAECQEFGWWAVFVPGIGWRPVPAGTPGATEDLNRLARDAWWSPERKRWVLA